MILLWLVIVDDVKGITEGVPLPKQTAHLCQSLLWSHGQHTGQRTGTHPCHAVTERVGGMSHMLDTLQSIRLNHMKFQNSAEKTMDSYEVIPLAALSKGNGACSVFSTPNPCTLKS